MSKKTVAVAAMIFGVLLPFGCKSSSSLMTGQPVIVMTLWHGPLNPKVNEQVEFIFTADSSAGVRWGRIDFENDGVWDVERFYGYTMVVDGFNHAYPSAGQVTARVEVEISGGQTDSRTRTFTVSN